MPVTFLTLSCPDCLKDVNILRETFAVRISHKHVDPDDTPETWKFNPGHAKCPRGHLVKINDDNALAGEDNWPLTEPRGSWVP